MDFSLATAFVIYFGILVGFNAQSADSVFNCKTGEEYYSCRSPCQPSCDSLTNGFRGNCSGPCIGGCFCRTGLVRNNDNTCITAEECFRPQCKENEEYIECGSACELNCTNYADSMFCTKPCHNGCFCKQDYVRDSNRRCVDPSTCNVAGNQQCGVNEHYVNCVSFCNNCWEMNYCKTPYCRPGCDCKPGFYKDYYGLCVTESQCYSSLYGLQNSCGGEHEVYTACVNRCNNCMSGGRCLHTQLYCEPGCDCDQGYLRNDYGVCVPQQYCFNQKCQEKEIYLKCGPSCRSSCQNYRTVIYDSCKRDCVPGCHCEGSLVLGPDGKCIRPELCPLDQPVQCPFNEVYYPCMPSCRHTCETFNDSFATCDTSCFKGCFCKGGLVRRKDGACVPPSECRVLNNPSCPPSEVFYQCKPTCRTTCQSLNSTGRTEICPLTCEPGCFCQPGLVRNDVGTCVRPEECTPTTGSCPAGEVFYQCRPTCRTTCETANSTSPCLLFCVSGCACPNGFVKRMDGICVRPQHCLIECGPNEEYDLCGSPCPETCTNPSPICENRCAKGCFCRNGFVLGPDGICISPSDCPRRILTPTSNPDIYGRRGGYNTDGTENSTLPATTLSETVTPDTTGNNTETVTPDTTANNTETNSTTLDANNTTLASTEPTTLQQNESTTVDSNSTNPTPAVTTIIVSDDTSPIPDVTNSTENPTTPLKTETETSATRYAETLATTTQASNTTVNEIYRRTETVQVVTKRKENLTTPPTTPVTETANVTITEVTTTLS